VPLIARSVLIAAALALVAIGLTRPSPAHAETRKVLVVGDSLAVGMRPYLGTMLVDSQVTWDVRSGRTTPTGMQRLRAHLRQETPQTVVISLGTNDGPDPARFASRVRRTLRAVPARACVVWASINRPPRKGPYRALNGVLRDAARHDPRLTVIDWDAAVTLGKVALPDGLHPDPAGFRYRSSLFAAAVERGCGTQS
jgi:lysophospholipase L1-like esterase